MQALYLRKLANLLREFQRPREIVDCKDASQAFDSIELHDLPSETWRWNSALSASVTVGASLRHATHFICVSVSISRFSLNRLLVRGFSSGQSTAGGNDPSRLLPK